VSAKCVGLLAVSFLNNRQKYLGGKDGSKKGGKYHQSEFSLGEQERMAATGGL